MGNARIHYDKLSNELLISVMTTLSVLHAEYNKLIFFGLGAAAAGYCCCRVHELATANTYSTQHTSTATAMRPNI